MDSLRSWPQAGLRALTQALIGLRPGVRRLVPRGLHHVAGQAARWLIRSVEATGVRTDEIDSFAPAARPLFNAEAFAAGPILHANTALAWGGAERQLVNLLTRLPHWLDRPVGLLCLRLGESPEFDFFLPELAKTVPPPRNAMPEAAAAAQLHRLGGASAVSQIAEALAWAPKDFVADVLRFAGEFAVQRPRAVHGWQDGVGLAAGFAALAVGVPRIVVAGRNVRPANFSYYRPYMQTAYLLLAAEPRITLCNNSEAGARDYAAWLGIDPARIEVVRNGIDEDRVRRIQGAEVQAFRARLGVPEGAPLIGSIFRLYPEKRPQLWVRAAHLVGQRVPEAHFVLFGSGSMEGHVLREARRRGLGDRLKLMPPTQELSLALSSFDAFVLTSQYEGTPNVVLEAGLAGVPVVAMDAGAVAETVAEGRTGYVVADRPDMSDEDRAACIADRVVALLRDSPWRHQVTRSAPEFVRTHYGMDRMLAETIALYGLGSSLSPLAGRGSG
jgi:glycosyltransferase involved in cell wall biosynthesis